MLFRILPVFAILFVGYFAGAARLFPSTRDAIGVLNRFSLYLAAPLLIFAGMVDPALVLPLRPGFYLAHIVVLAVGIGVVWLLRPVKKLGAHAGTMALAVAYGNITFLGIPVIHRAFGDASLGLAALSSGVHTLLAMTVGPALFLLWNTQGGEERIAVSDVARRLVRQPLVWAPVFGLVCRVFGERAQTVLFDYAMVIGVSAGATAIFMLGLYVWESRAALKRLAAPSVVAVALKLVILPFITLGVLLVLRGYFPITPMESAVILSQSAMPTAITTYSLAEEYQNDRETVASAAILSAMVSLVTLPLVMSFAEGYFLMAG